MKQSEFKSYDELPLFLNAKTVAQVLGISAAGTYELLHRKDFPVVKIGSRLVVPKEQFLAWIEKQVGGDAK
ncbi:helix-turn-helix domain-containing protein [Acutalibacter caecimuris]|uniref:helix-turn-helix domain-containing protein n=1 Tax=Acutalibacter caecimuris TaxID=3093657 RepID=UPI002AC9AC16|nr:helix-turn-helix domain-containing protein [Acutalibacter sp. M00118]